MKWQHIRSKFIPGFFMIGLILLSHSAASSAAASKTLLMLGGQNCELFEAEISKSLKTLKGVKSLDFKSTPGHVLVEHDPELKPEVLVEKINKIKGSRDGKEGFCSAEIME